MNYSKIVEAVFISRPNRFIANVEINGTKTVVHVKNTGRCRELLIPGVRVYLSLAANPNRKTKYDLIAVEKKQRLVNIDSQIPNDVANEWLKKGGLFSKNALIKREFKYGNSRIDFFIEDENKKILLEVKGVTLENNGMASFPDAPTERGVKHIKELVASLNEGYEAYILFVVQMGKVKGFCPNDENHKAFGDALREAYKSGVKIIAMDCLVTPDSIQINQPVRLRL